MQIPLRQARPRPQGALRVLAGAIALAVAVVASKPAEAQPANLQRETDVAVRDWNNLRREASDLEKRRADLTRKYQTELAAVDRLKKQRPSWRRDRQLREALARTLDTATQLDKLAAGERAVQTRRNAVADQARTRIDREWSSASEARRQQLAQHRRAIGTQRVAEKRIVLPDTEIDPLADPEELEQQAAVLRQVEDDLARKVAQLERQVASLQKTSALRREHARAGELIASNDGEPQRQASSSGGRVASDEDTGAAAGPPQDGPQTGVGPSSDFAPEAVAAVLAGVVDSATADALRGMAHTKDPATQTSAVRRARDQVAARLGHLRAKRAAIEERARQLNRQR